MKEEESMTDFETFQAANMEQKNRVTTAEELDALVERVKAAQQKLSLIHI